MTVVVVSDLIIILPKIVYVPRIGIPNKGDWTHKSLRYTVKGNPFVFNFPNWICCSEDTWK